MMIGAWQKRIIAYLITIFFPIVSIYVMLLLGFGALPTFVVGFIFGIVGIVITHIVTLNAMSRFELGGTPAIIPIDSRGALNLYPMVVSSKERVLRAKLDGKEVEGSYGYDNIFEMIFHREKVPAWNDETHLHVLIPREDLRDHRLTMVGLPAFLYNKVGGWFWTKSELNKVEDGLVLENQLSHLEFSTREFEKHAKIYADRIVDKIWEKLTQPATMMFFIVLVLLVLALFFGGDILDFVSSFGAKFSGAAAGAQNSLAPLEASQPLP